MVRGEVRDVGKRTVMEISVRHKNSASQSLSGSPRKGSGMSCAGLA